MALDRMQTNCLKVTRALIPVAVLQYSARSVLFCVFAIAFAGCSYPSSIERSLRHETRYAAALEPGETALRWLGTAGYEIRHKPASTGVESVILIDPFLTRPRWSRFLASMWFNAPLQADRAAIEAIRCREQLAFDRAQGVFISHGHYDHLMDAPYIANTWCPDAQFVGSQTALNIARALSVPAGRLINARSGHSIYCGAFAVTPVESLHARLLGEHIYNTGHVCRPPTPPLTEAEFKLGRQFNYLIEVDGLKIYHHGCADLIDEEVRSKVGKVDVLILGLALRGNTPGDLERMLSLTDPQIVIPTHHDDFFRPLRRGVRVMRNAGFRDFVRRTRRLAPRVHIITLDFFDELRVTATGNVL